MAVVTFRYHVTSLAAVLLALAAGIVVGTTSLSASPAGTAGPGAASPAATAIPTSGAAEELAEQVSPKLLRGLLPDQRVLVLVAPDAPAGAARTVVTALRAAGSTVTGQVRLLPTLLDPSGEATVSGVVQAVAPGAASGTAVEGAATLLASALVTSDQGKDLSGTDAQRVLGGFTGGSLIASDAPLPTAKATLVLLLAGPARGPALAAVAAGFQARAGTVVAATAAAASGRGVIALLRDRPPGPSDVDGLGTSVGLLGTVLALGEQASGGAGHYGTGPRAGQVVPPAS